MIEVCYLHYGCGKKAINLYNQQKREETKAHFKRLRENIQHITQNTSYELNFSWFLASFEKSFISWSLTGSLQCLRSVLTLAQICFEHSPWSCGLSDLTPGSLALCHGISCDLSQAQSWSTRTNSTSQCCSRHSCVSLQTPPGHQPQTATVTVHPQVHTAPLAQ